MFTCQQIVEQCEFLEEILIPDLRKSGSDATADDFQRCVDMLNQLLGIHVQSPIDESPEPDIDDSPPIRRQSDDPDYDEAEQQAAESPDPNWMNN